MDVSPPASLLGPLDHRNIELFGPGPTVCPERVLKAISLPTMGLLREDFNKLLNEVREGVKYLFQTKNRLTLVLSTSGNGAVEATFANLLEPGETAILAVSGFWGEKAAFIAQKQGVNVVKLEGTLGEPIEFSRIEEAIIKHKPKLFYIIHGETSTGVLQPVDGLGELCHKHNCLFALDTVITAGTVPIFMDRWNIDVVFTAPQKGLFSPPCLAPISFSSKAEQVIRNRKTPVTSYFMDVLLLGTQWRCHDPWGLKKYHHTISSNALCGLRESLAMISEEGIENVWSRHVDTSNFFCKKIEDLGLKLFVKNPEHRTPSVVTIVVPDGIEQDDVIEYLTKKYNIEVGRRIGNELPQILRVGLMGYNSTIEKASRVADCIFDAVTFVKNNNQGSK